MRVSHYKLLRLLFVLLLVMAVVRPFALSAFTFVDTERSMLDFNGYARFGAGLSGVGGVQTNFIIPESTSKYRLGNEADYYGELAFNYNLKLKGGLDRTMDLVWRSAYYRDYGAHREFDITYLSELYLKLNNLFGGGESLWLGRRFYDRKYIEILDRYWLNSAQDGFGIGVEGLLDRGDEELKVAIISFNDRDSENYASQSRSQTLFNYTGDVRWEGIALGESSDVNFAANYTLRPKKEELGYETRHGFGLFAWVDYEQERIQNYTAAIFRYGANVLSNNGSGLTIKENQFDDRRIITDLRNTYLFEISNNFRYDNRSSYALDAVALISIHDYGTEPYFLESDGSSTYFETLGRKFCWFTIGARNILYLCNIVRLNLELSSEYAIIDHLATTGYLNKITVMPELARSKALSQSAVLRPYITYAAWSESLRGYIGSSPSGAKYGTARNGFTYGLQMELCW